MDNVTKVKIVKKKKILLRIKEADKSDEKDEPAHRQAPNIEKPYDPNHPDNK